jgi:putative phosphoribosyl transferase
MNAPFQDRFEAGRFLAGALGPLAGRGDVIVLALPRGGVPVGYEVARRLDAPLDVMLVRKVGVPGQEELAMGAIASGGVRVISEDVVRAFGVADRAIAMAAAYEEHELKRRERAYRGNGSPPDLKGKIVVLVDDGLATGATMRAALAALRAQNVAAAIVAVPVGARDSCEALRLEADEIFCLRTPDPFVAVGEFYRDFTQTSEDDVRELLHRSARERQATGSLRYPDPVYGT